MSGGPTRRPACTGGRSSHGKTTIGVAFIPDWRTIKRSLVSLAIPFVAKRGFVCLDCGSIGHNMDGKGLGKYRDHEATEPRRKRPPDEVGSSPVAELPRDR